MRRYLLLLLAALGMLQAAEFGVINMKTLEKLERQFLTFGYGLIGTEGWTSFTTSGFYTESVDSNIVFMSLPDIGGDTTQTGSATAIRIRNKVMNADHSISFEAKMYQPNDSFCLKTWFVPTPIYNEEITFLVSEKGAFLLRNEYPFFVGDDRINRTSGDLQNDTVNWFWFQFDSGCTYGWNIATEPCRFNKTQIVAEIGVIATIQTLVHDTYLLLRVHRTQRNRIGMILTPHDSLTPSYFESFGEHETAGYVAFPTGIALQCIEGVQFETKMFFPVTSNRFLFTYVNTYPTAPGVFGMLTTQNSLTDSTSVRVFNRTELQSYAITQEDQCATEQVVHTAQERVTVFVFSLIPQGTGDYCFTNPDPSSMPSGEPTSEPTLSPTLSPTVAPSAAPTVAPSAAPTLSPTVAPSAAPTLTPTVAPSAAPTLSPTAVPTTSPTELPTNQDPTSSPTSSAPTFSPTAAPTLSPTAAPTFSPTCSPTVNPTNTPTSSPTVSPTPAPTASPTLAPTANPTLAPTPSEFNKTCVYEILLVDLFGDGWVNAELNVTINSRSTYHKLNCSCDVLNITAKGCNVEIKVTSFGEKPITPWEVYWQIESDGQDWYGDYDSHLIIENEKVVYHDGMLDADSTLKENRCKECEHPKPPPKPSPGGKGKDGGKGDNKDKAKGNSTSGAGGSGAGDVGGPSGGGPGAKPPPKPPVSVEIDLFDEIKNGWYVKTGETDWCDAESHGAKGPIEAPNIFTYPRYYIMNRERTKLIKMGTICNDHRGTEHCVDMLPFHGDFVWRVAGFEKTWEGEMLEWHFCGNYGGLGHEMEFKMRGGECIPGGRLTAEMYCEHGYESLVGFTGTILLSGLTLPSALVARTHLASAVTGTSPVEVLSQKDTIFLEKEVSQMFFDNHPVTVTAVTVQSSDSVVVTVTSTIIAEEHGVDGSDMSLVDSLSAEMQSSIERSFSAGAFVSMLQHDLSLHPVSGDDLFAQATGLTAQLQSLEVSTVEFIEKGSYSSAEESSSSKDDAATATGGIGFQMKSTMALHSLGQFTLVALALGFAAFAAFVAYRRQRPVRDTRGDHEKLPLNSSHLTATADLLPPAAGRVMSADECDNLDVESSHGSSALFQWNRT